MVVDTYSRYLAVIEMHRMNADATNAALQDIFKRWGLPLIIHNGPPFQSSAFCDFWEGKGVRVRKSIPLSPQSNGLVKRQNQSVIKTLSAAKIDGKNWRKALEEFVHHHNTLIPHSRLNITPFELLVGWKFRGTFPSLWSEMRDKQLDRVAVREVDADAKLGSSKYADRIRGAKCSDIRIGDTVFLKQQKKSKVDPTFSTERYTVVAQDGSKMVISSGNGVQYARSVNDLKKVPGPPSRSRAAGLESDDDDDNPDEIAETDGEQGKNENQTQSGLRRWDTVKRPGRYNDDLQTISVSNQALR